jgi:hypothetical protein
MMSFSFRQPGTGMSPVLRKNSRGRQNPTCNLCYSTSRAKRKPLISKGMLGAYKFLRSHRPRNRRTRGKSMQHLGYSPTAEAGMIGPANWRRRSYGPLTGQLGPYAIFAPRNAAQACRKLTLLLVLLY